MDSDSKDPAPTPLGQYLGRSVVTTTLDAVSAGPLERSSVFLWSGGLDEDTYRRLIQDVASKHPCVVATAGPLDDIGLGSLLEVLQTEPGPHVMTMAVTGDVDAAVEDFIWSAWPTPERVPEWNQYTFVASAAEIDLVNRAVLERIDPA